MPRMENIANELNDYEWRVNNIIDSNLRSVSVERVEPAYTYNTNINPNDIVTSDLFQSYEDYAWSHFASFKLLTEKNAIDFLKKKGYCIYKKVMETE